MHNLIYATINGVCLGVSGTIAYSSYNKYRYDKKHGHLYKAPLLVGGIGVILPIIGIGSLLSRRPLQTKVAITGVSATSGVLTTVVSNNLLQTKSN
jgi:nitrate reductase gamma subunit